jgi:hypothetical protein
VALNLKAITRPPTSQVKVTMTTDHYERLKKAAAAARRRPWEVLAKLLEDGLPK